MKSYFCEGFLQQPAHKVNISRSPRSKHTLKSYSKCALCYSRARLRAVVNVVETNNSLNLPQNSDVDYPQLLNFKNEEPMADVMLSIEDVDPPNIEILDDEASNYGDSEIDNQTLLDPPPLVPFCLTSGEQEPGQEQPGQRQDEPEDRSNEGSVACVLFALLNVVGLWEGCLCICVCVLSACVIACAMCMCMLYPCLCPCVYVCVRVCM